MWSENKRCSRRIGRYSYMCTTENEIDKSPVFEEMTAII